MLSKDAVYFSKLIYYPGKKCNVKFLVAISVSRLIKRLRRSSVAGIRYASEPVNVLGILLSCSFNISCAKR